MMHDALAPRPDGGPAPLDPSVAPALAEIAALKRVPGLADAHRSLADEGFRRAWTALLDGEAPETVALAEVAFAAVQIAIAPVDASQLRFAGVEPEDRRTVYANAAARMMGDLPEPVADRLAEIVEGTAPTGEGPQFVELLATQPRAGALREGAARLIMPPEEMQSEHGWCVGVIGGLLQRQRGEPAAGAFLLGLAHHLGDAYTMTSATDLSAAQLQQARARSERRALEQCAGDLAEALEAGLAAREDVAAPSVGAFVAADLIDRVLQQRHYANLAGFSLSDAMDAREFAAHGPLYDFQLDVLRRFRLIF
ncbi:hypothetical protein [Acuticoccus sp. I52.16.1]|uniref:hypothetical protein n=1 Tax=Acuticoccus sp. I52.16.1 TaxID=2928472 RepID=UPI001FD4BFEC|nr:hypothetical protein [Acuticoccus sp. I52.16.1]UOM35179.1 hypothetical protein MRB58_02915 [Acuticoccus sp. I52.16.1]